MFSQFFAGNPALNAISMIVMAILILAFCGIVIWAFFGPKHYMDRMADLPFESAQKNKTNA